MQDATEIRPFSNGTEADCWTAHNCERCFRTKDDAPDDMPSCPIAAAITVGYITGTIPLRLAERAGWKDRKWPTRCAEFCTVDPKRRARDLAMLAAWTSGEPIR